MIARIFNRKYKLFVLSSIILLGTLIYSNTFYSSFHFDDLSSIVDNSAIRNIFNLQNIWNFWPTRFITYFSVALNYHFSQLNVLTYHLFNLAVHLSSGILVWWFMLLTFSTPAMKAQKITERAKLIAFFAGLVFIAHPIQTQGVTYIIQRAASLATFFYLLSLSLYVKSRLLQEQGQSPVVSRFIYYGSLIAVVMAMFTKEMTITLPFMILFYESCFLKIKRLNLRYLIPFFATLLIIPLTMFLTKSVDFIGMKRTLGVAPSISSGQYFFNQLRVMVTYLRLLFIPINQNLVYYYPITKNLFNLPILASLIFLISILTIAIRIFSKYKLISFGIFWFFLTLLPESSLIPIKDCIFEHRLYLPMVGFSFFLVSLIYYFFENKALKSMVIALLIITSSYAILTYRRNIIWRNELTLWNDIVHKSPKKVSAYNNRGTAYKDQGNIQKAFSDFNKAIELNPNLEEAYNNRGIIYLEQKNVQRAFSDYNKAIAINPNYADAYYNRGNLYYQQGKFVQAISDYNRAIEINPNYSEAYNNRAIIYKEQARLDQAFSDLTKAIEIDPNNDKAFINRGVVCRLMGKMSGAILDYTKAIQINPNLPLAYSNRGFAYYLAKEYDKAWIDVHKAQGLGYAINPEFLNTLRKASGRDK